MRVRENQRILLDDGSHCYSIPPRKWKKCTFNTDNQMNMKTYEGIQKFILFQSAVRATYTYNLCFLWFSLCKQRG